MTRIILQDNKSVHIDGYKRILNYDKESIKLLCSKKIIEIYGNNLNVIYFTSIQIEIEGMIDGVKWLEKE